MRPPARDSTSPKIAAAHGAKSSAASAAATRCPCSSRPAETSRVFTAAAAGPPPFWSTGPSGADAVMFRSLDAGESFQALGDDALPERGMVMRFRADPENEGDFFAVTTEGSVIRTREMAASATLIGERLPPAYDLVALP